MEKNLFGKAFKQLRESRGISLKEAAGDIVSPQFLSRFEKGEKGISLENFNRLLISLGLSYGEFESVFASLGGDCIIYHDIILEEVIQNYQDFAIQSKKFKERFDGYLKDNPVAFRLASENADFVYSANSPRTEMSQKKLQDILIHLDKVTTYSTLELSIIPYMILQFSLESIKKLTQNLLNMYSQPLSDTIAVGVLGTLSSIVKYYTNNGYYIEADKIYHEIKRLHTYNRGLLATPLMILECFYIFNLIAWNKPEAAPLYNNMVSFLESSKFIDNQYYTIMLENFITRCHTLNKSEKPISEW